MSKSDIFLMRLPWQVICLGQVLQDQRRHRKQKKRRLAQQKKMAENNKRSDFLSTRLMRDIFISK